jgi:uncharacterized protein
VQPIYFGKAGRQLFGVYHPPQQKRAADAVVICNPIVQEYMRTHWALRKLAASMAREGLHVMRFDYLGTGDSAGGAELYSVAQWCADIKAAAAELLDLSGARKVSLVGLRLGGALAATVAGNGLAVKDLVLWEAPASGAAHLVDLDTIERTKLESHRTPLEKGADELLGYAMPASLRAELAGVDLSKGVACNADRVLLFAADARPDHDLIKAAVKDKAGRPPEVSIVAEDAKDRQSGVLLSSKVLQAITQGLTTRGAA